MRSKLRNIFSLIRSFSFWLSLLALLIIMYDFGFGNQPGLPVFILSFFVAVLWIALPAMISRYCYRKDRPKIRVWFFDAGLFLFLLAIIAINLTRLVLFQRKNRQNSLRIGNFEAL